MSKNRPDFELGYSEINGNIPRSLIASAAKHGVVNAAGMERRIFNWGQEQREQAFFGGLHFRHMPISSDLVRTTRDTAWRMRRSMNRSPRDGR